MDSNTEMVSAREYARRHGLRPNTVSQWAREGRLNAIKTNGSWMICPNQAPPYSKNRVGDFTEQSRLRCGTCKRSRYLAHYTPTGVTRRQCRDCHKYASTYKKFPHRASVISYAIDLAIYQELSNADENIKADRKRRVEAHAERIQSLGLAGNGKDWKD